MPLDEQFLISLFDSTSILTVDEILYENDFTMQRAMNMAMGYLYSVYDRGGLDDHPDLIKMVKEHRVAFNENKMMIFGDGYFDD